jgi:rare lipoprotein A
MPTHSLFRRIGQALGVLLTGALLVACASPVSAPEAVVRSAGPVVPRPAAHVPPAVAPTPPPASASAAPAAPAESVSAPVTAEAAASPATAPDQPLAKGLASWYGPKFHGRRTASGERYDMHGLTAAHKTLPFGTKVRVRSVHTGKEVVVRINDRGPYKRQRIIDLSLGAISALGVRQHGVTEVVLLRE